MHLAGRHYRSDEEVIGVVQESFREQDEGTYTTGRQGLRHQWRKRVDRKEDYVDKPKLVLALTNNRIMVGSELFNPTS